MGADKRRYEKFRLGWGAYEWDVDKACRLYREGGNEVYELPVAHVAHLLNLISVNTEKAMSDEVSYDYPVIIVPLPEGIRATPEAKMLIDGYHRLYRATQEGRETIPAVMLTPEQEVKCRLRPNEATRKRYVREELREQQKARA